VHLTPPTASPAFPITVEPWSVCTPEAAAWHLRAQPGLAWLDSSLAGGRLGRWSVVACAPRWTLTARGRQLTRVEAGGAGTWDGDAIAALAAAVEAEPAVVAPPGLDAAPFLGGAIGYLGFELGRQIERLPATTVDDVGAPDLAVGWYDAALLWDEAAGSGWLVGRPEAVEALRARLAGAGPLPPRRELLTRTPLQPNLARAEYLDAVRRALDYIAAGDIYQVNLSQRLSARVHASGLDLYRRLRAISPAPFAAYLALGAVEVLSSSPERLLLAEGAALETRPIKGTRPRGATTEADARLAAELRASAKDNAEHVMIVDLERNDLGRVAEVGSVAVPELAALETYAQVHHLTSTVTGRRRAGVGVEALLRAIFPGGSVSGAPKIRALEIIDELEPTVRGVYTGAIGSLSAHGRIDLNVAIRTVTLAGGVAYAHVGGAIVADSDPAAEYRETLDKARGMAEALGAVLPADGADEA
jgi:para-aminobenzoate synthetase component 1